MFRRLAARFALGVLVGASSLHAKDLFNVDVVGTTDSLSVGGSTLVDLIENLVDAQGQFAVFDGQAFDAALKYGSLVDALTFSSNADGTSITVEIPITGFTQTFTGPSRDDVQDQIVEFLKKEGSKEVSRFIKQINQQTLIGVLDGNPQALTHVQANEAFRKFGRRPNNMQGPDLSLSGGGNFHFDIQGGMIDADEDGDGQFFVGAINSSFAFGDRLALSISTLGAYRSIEGAATYSMGFELGLPFIIVPGNLKEPVSWQVTPFVNAGGAASVDQAAGGLTWGAGITSLLSYRFEDFTISMGNQFSFHEGVDLSYDDYKFETDVNQQLLKNGVQITWGREAYVDAGVIHTYAFKKSAVESYFTPFVGLGLKFGQASGLRVQVSADFGDDYLVYRGQAQLYFGL